MKFNELESIIKAHKAENYDIIIKLGSDIEYCDMGTFGYYMDIQRINIEESEQLIEIIAHDGPHYVKDSGLE